MTEISGIMSKVLGYAVVLGAVGVKIPQIKIMLKKQSAEGISYLSSMLDVFCVLSNLGYAYYQNYAFSTYGDSLFNYLQQAIICVLIPKLSKNRPLALMTFLSIFGLGVSTYFKILPMEVFTGSQMLQMPLGLISRGLQIVSIHKSGHCDNLSAVTIFLVFFGCLTRVFTSLSDAGDLLMAANFGVSTLGYGIILGQIVYYSKDKKSKAE